MRSGARKRLSASLVAALILALLNTSEANALSTGNCIVNVSTATGVVLVNNGGFCYLAFSAIGANSFTVPTGVTTSALLVVAGGGGGGGGAWGGGGGAGGVVYSSSYPLTVGATMNISVGGGGAGGGADLTPANNRAGNGTNSWINSSSTFVAIGGGGGAGYAYGDATVSNRNGTDGGNGGGGTEHASGGAGGASTQTSPTYATTIYGRAGGATAAANNQSGGGGGGAGAIGTANTAAGVGGGGGAGTADFATWFTAIGQFGVSGYIAGGGGGGSSTTAGGGGSGGGGAGGGNTNRPGTAGSANTGSGGGGASYAGAAYVGGAGGSGLIIFRFAEIVNPAVINTPTISGTPYKGLSVTITATVDSAGTISFFADNKRIAACLNVRTTGTSPNFSATCPWKPTVQGFHSLKATIKPTNVLQSQQTSGSKVVFVIRRTTTR